MIKFQYFTYPEECALRYSTNTQELLDEVELDLIFSVFLGCLSA